jgi:serine/threonine protein kinase
MWRLLSSLWGAIRAGRPELGAPAPHDLPTPAAEESWRPAAADTGPSPEPFPVIEGSPEGYRRLQPLGRGTGGEVFRAEAPDGRTVALKRVPWWGDEPPVSRHGLEPFRSLHHPFLLETLACYLAADHVALVTELADDDLHSWFRRCQNEGQPGVPAWPLLRYLGEAAEALDYLHARGILHRNLRPSNLLRLGGHARVADFIPWPPPEYPHQVIGRPVYAAPEVWRGQFGTHSDQFALVVVYFQMRTGRLPFTGTTLIELMYHTLTGEPELGPLPEVERGAVRRALDREPARRFGSCGELVRELKRAVAGECGAPRGGRPTLDPAWLRWNGGCVAKLARAITDEGRFADLPVLADALEEAGCTDGQILAHCRKGGQHAGGCWVLDLILSKDR